MAVYSVTHHQRVDNYAVVQLLNNALIQAGDSFTIAGLGHNLNGTHTVYACPEYYFLGVDEQGDLLLDTSFPILNQVLFYDVGDPLTRSEALPPGTLTITETCQWVTAQNIEDWLGIGTASSLDQTFLTQCAASANAFCFRRRKEAGYIDSLSTCSDDVKLGTIMYGGGLYRQRGGMQDMATFDGYGTASTRGLSAIIKQLLGVDRPACA